MNYLSNKSIKTRFLKSGLFGVGVFLIISCNINLNENESAENKMISKKATNGFSFKYDLKKPSNSIGLPFELKEISGLSYYQKNQLICMNDERADIYVIDYLTGGVVAKRESDKAGDYEGIEYVDGSAYLLKSNGTISEYTDFNTPQQQKKTYKTKISTKNDAEGLVYDPESNSLLIACKNKPSLKDVENKRKYKRCIYQFSLKNKELTEKPFLCIDLEKIEKEYGKKNFMPSAIAFCLIDKNFYVLSSVGNLLLVIDRNSNILYLERLNPSIFPQPEGICFSPDGEFLFISNEGRIKKGNILVFKRQTKN